MWIACGESFENKVCSRNAKRVLDELAWPVRFTELPGVAGDWPRGLEEEVYAWFEVARDDALMAHVSRLN